MGIQHRTQEATESRRMEERQIQGRATGIYLTANLWYRYLETSAHQRQKAISDKLEETTHHTPGEHQQKNRGRQRKLPDPLHLHQEHRG